VERSKERVMKPKLRPWYSLLFVTSYLVRITKNRNSGLAHAAVALLKQRNSRRGDQGLGATRPRAALMPFDQKARLNMAREIEEDVEDYGPFRPLQEVEYGYPQEAEVAV